MLVVVDRRTLGMDVLQRIDYAVSNALEALYGIEAAPTREQVIAAVAGAVGAFEGKVTSIAVLVHDDTLCVDLMVTL